MKKIIALLLLLAVLLPASALADVRRGDRGDDVYELQELLFRLGWIFEEPDGIFGKKTEAAVKQYQGYVGVRQDGVATDELIGQLRVDWEIARRELYGDETDEAPVFCKTSFYNGLLRTDYCAEHIALLRQEADAWYGGPDGVRAANALWEDAIDEFHAHLQAISPAERQLELLSAIAAWKANVEAQRAALTISEPDAERAEEVLNEALKARLILMCGINGGAMEWRFDEIDATPDDGYGDYADLPVDDAETEGQPLDEADYGCVAWSEDIGVAFISLCPTHAALAERLREIAEGGSDPEVMRALLSDWEGDLDAQYERWAEARPDAAEAILEARDCFGNALDCLDRLNASADADFTVGWQLNAVVRESLRLCELNHEADLIAD